VFDRNVHTSEIATLHITHPPLVAVVHFTKEQLEKFYTMSCKV